MARKSGGSVVGYESGKICSFTPSRGARWIDSFNQRLEEENKRSGISRNKFTEILLEQVLEGTIHTDNSVSIDCSDLSPTEISLLKSEHIQSLIKNIVRDMAVITTKAVASHVNSTIDVEKTVMPSEHITPIEEKKESEANKRVDSIFSAENTVENESIENSPKVSVKTNVNDNGNNAALRRLRGLTTSVKGN
jgi:hypothetical protein